MAVTIVGRAAHSGFPIQPITIPWARVNNHKLTLSFSPATEADEQALAALIPENAQTIDDLPTSLPGLIEVVPELKLDGEVIHTGTTGRNLGEELTLFNAVFLPGRGNGIRPLSVIVGSFLAIGSESGSISSQNLEQLRQKVEQTQATLETEDPDQIATLDREDLLGDLFHAGMLGYYAQYTALGNLMGLQSNGQMILQAGMGLHGYEPRVNTLFGFPRGISPGGVVFDLPIAGVQLTDGLEQEKTAQFNQQIGLLSSALEHAVPEQMFSTEAEPADAISAVKALSKANAEGQRIYQMTRDNMASTLPNLNLATETESEIRTALRAGLTVIAHTDNVSVPGWTGAGYIIFDPETGSGAYKISGGANGGVLTCEDTCQQFALLALFIALAVILTALTAIIISVFLIYPIIPGVIGALSIATILSHILNGAGLNAGEQFAILGAIAALLGLATIGQVIALIGLLIILFDKIKKDKR